ncbi:MAG: FeoA domain-containing protein [Chloroflexota bacterium]|nr:FeoA domain-containing protein [Chloroflexota bacterium]
MIPDSLSETVQTYLVSIARLREDGEPVPLSALARELSLAPGSVNEMCRKLQDQGLVIYRPYKGASLTPEGERYALSILRCHRLWEVFLVEKLGLGYEQAHEAACRLEHDTSELVADQLDVYLDNPLVNPLGHPIPRLDGALPTRRLLPLHRLAVGWSGRVVRCDVDGTGGTFLRKQGIHPGALLTVVAVGQGALSVQVGDGQVSLALPLARDIQVEPKGREEEDILGQEENEVKAESKTAVDRVPLHTLEQGQEGIVIRVGGKGPARRRMMDMGLVPGAEVKVVRVAPLGDPIEFEVRGYSLSLRKSEASDIIVEISEEKA